MNCLFKWGRISVFFTFYVMPHILNSHCTLKTVQYTVQNTHRALQALHYTLHTTQWTIFTTHCTTYATHYTLHNVHYTLHTTQCKRHTAHCTLHTTHCSPITVSKRPIASPACCIVLLCTPLPQQTQQSRGASLPQACSACSAHPAVINLETPLLCTSLYITLHYSTHPSSSSLCSTEFYFWTIPSSL